MTGLYIIAFLAPLAVFGPLAYLISRAQRAKPDLFESKQRAMMTFVILPLGVTYGLLLLSAAALFVGFILEQ